MKKAKQKQQPEYAVVSRQLLDEKHPVHSHFIQWLNGKVATKRQAAKFLQQFPKYRQVQETPANVD